MENDYSTTDLSDNFDFLNIDEVQSHFADLNIELLRGRHIQKEDYYIYNLLDKFQNEFRHYYKCLYKLDLVKDRSDNEAYYYLDFPSDNKGKLYHSSRHTELTSKQIIIGLMLMNMYYERFFEHPKKISMKDIEREIMEGEDCGLYKRLLFGELRDNYTSKEWNAAIRWIKRTLAGFNVLGWIQRETHEDPAESTFILKTSIHRLAKLYRDEIENFEQFVEQYESQKNK